MNHQCPVVANPSEQLSLRVLNQAHGFELYDDLNGSRFDFNSRRAFGETIEQIQVYSYHMYFRGMGLDLTNCQLTLRLFQLFSSSRNYQCTLIDILKHVYGVSLNIQQSPRYRRSARMRAIKLISRARRLASETFSDVGSEKIEWFAYDHDVKAWSLFKQRDHYVYLQ
jgi:hypothetical protein